MSGSSLDGLDIVLAELTVQNGIWNYKILVADCIPYDEKMKEDLKNATSLSSKDYLLLHTSFGHYCGEMVNLFLQKHSSETIDIIASHGHTTFHLPKEKTTAQLGDGSAIAAVTGIQTVTDLRAMDVALGGEGAPIIPIGEKLLFPGFRYFLNIGGIANISIHEENETIAFDVCPANRVLNQLVSTLDLKYDEDGRLASEGKVNEDLLNKLNQFEYYEKPYPKSLPNSFGTEIIYPLLKNSGLSIKDALATYTDHIAWQLGKSLLPSKKNNTEKILVTGGGAFNEFLMKRIQHYLKPTGIQIIIPEEEVVNYKEAMVMALIGVLRLRNEDNVLASVTGALRNSIGGALWAAKKKTNY